MKYKSRRGLSTLGTNKHKQLLVLRKKPTLLGNYWANLREKTENKHRKGEKKEGEREEREIKGK